MSIARSNLSPRQSNDVSEPSHPARTGHCALLKNVILSAVANDEKNAKADAAIQLLMEHLDITPRQAEVLHWISEGKTNAEIGIITNCSFFTVKNHIKGIFTRLGVHSRVGAAASAYRVLVAIQLGGNPPLKVGKPKLPPAKPSRFRRVRKP